MSDNLEKFVLEYVVETKDSESKLKGLDDKVKNVHAKSKEAGKGFSALADEAKKGLGSAIGAAEGLAGALGAVAPAASAAAAAVGAIALAVKLTTEAMERLNEQRKVGLDSGFSGAGVEEMTRKLVMNGRGNVTRSMANESFKSTQSWLTDIQSDPTGQKEQAARMAMPWFHAYNADGSFTTNSQLYDQAARNWEKMPESGAHMQAKAMGMNFDVASAVRNTGAAGMDQSSLSTAQIEAYDDASKAAAHLKDSVAKLKEEFDEMGDEIGKHLLPVVSNVITAITDNVGGFSKTVEDLFGWNKNKGQKTAEDKVSDQLDADIKSGKFNIDPSGDYSAQYNIELARRVKAAVPAPKPGEKTAAQKDNEEAKKMLAQHDSANQKLQNDFAQFSQAVALFSASANNLAKSVSQQEILSNLFRGTGGPNVFNQPSSSGIGNGFTTGQRSSMTDRYSGKSKYHDVYVKAEEANGLPPGYLERLGWVESTQNARATSAKGAKGLTQLTDAISAKYGVTDPYDPEQNINGGGKFLADLVKEYGGDLLKATMHYNGGYKGVTSPSAETRKYRAKVYDGYYGFNSSGGNRQITRNKQLAESMSDTTGKPITQTVNEGDTQGDQDKIISLRKYQLENRIAAERRALGIIEEQAKNPSNKMDSDYVYKARAKLDSDISLLESFNQGKIRSTGGGPTDLTKQVPAAPGAQTVNITTNVNVNGHDPDKIGQVVTQKIQEGYTKMVNGNSSIIQR